MSDTPATSNAPQPARSRWPYVVPLIVLFVFLQRQLIRGIQLGAVKG